LGQFFDKLKSEGLYDDSLILIYGDHTPVLSSFTAGSITYDPSSRQGKEVPLIIKLPNETTGSTHPDQGAHIDIMPTVLDLLGIKTNQLMFGQSLFASGTKALQVCTDQLVAFKTNDDCKTMLETEKLKSAEIIRYDQFSNLAK
jgi:phosphoglycerol transferase MdoB-like AlkP superfamily enzyme